MNKPLLRITSLITSVLIVGSLTSCGTPTAEELAARDIGNNAALWDDEDYKSIAAKGCLAFKDAFDKSLGDYYLDWNSQLGIYMRVMLTTGALKDHKKWGPIGQVVEKLYANAMSRGMGGEGVSIPGDLTTKSFALCKEVGVDMNA
jgi:hypothetical protein